MPAELRRDRSAGPRSGYNTRMDNIKMKWRLDAGQIEVVDEAVAAVLRQKTPAERIALAAAAHRTARELIAARLGADHPEWTAAQLQAEVARRLTRGTT
jgi:hypothetical protein